MKEITRATRASQEEVDRFLKGSDPQERIIKIECSYKDARATVIHRDRGGVKHYDKQDFYPFCWAKQDAGRMMFKGDRNILKMRLQDYGIGVKALTVANPEGEVHQRMADGYRVMFYAERPMSMSAFSKFFDDAGVPLKPKEGQAGYGRRLYITVAPAEQFMISTGKRLFKGYESYDDLVRLSFDLETEGLDPSTDAISQIGIRTNKGFEKILTIEGDGDEKKANEMAGIREFFDYIADIDPDIVTGYNTENFDWNFMDVRSGVIEWSDLGAVSKRPNLPNGCYKSQREAILKLGGEVEKYYPTVMWGKHITDCLFSVRRAQALDSNMKKANLKYVTKYSKIAKKNRVYLPGNIINQTWLDNEPHYAFNDDNGDWWLGVSPRNMRFLTGGGETKAVNASWFTNIPHGGRRKPIRLTKRYTPEEYPKYDNYDAIEVSRVCDIPCDYGGMMGVPITFLDKYCPDQFAILGRPENMDLYRLKTRVYTGDECREAYRAKFGADGVYDLNARTVLDVGGILEKTYARVFIIRK